MRKEMRKLNQAKYAHSEEEVQRLISEGYSPVDSEPEDGGADPAQGQSGADGTGQTADPAQGQNADADKQKEKRGARKND